MWDKTHHFKDFESNLPILFPEKTLGSLLDKFQRLIVEDFPTCLPVTASGCVQCQDV